VAVWFSGSGIGHKPTWTYLGT